MPEFVYGPYAFTFSGAYSGYGPTELRGSDRTMYVIEHQIPAREGGIVEYLGSRQPTYQFRGFVVQQENGSTAALVLSGSSWVSINADDAKDFLKNLRGSGVQLLKLESTYSNGSGYQNLYENGFFQIEKMIFAFEPGHAYPYYPYSIDFRGASPNQYGVGSGTTANVFAQGLSGYLMAYQLAAGTKGETINALGLYVVAVASGNAKMAIYNSGGTAGILAQTASQAVHSGWNYFPLRPSFSTTSGAALLLAMLGDTIAYGSGYIVGAVNQFSGYAFSGYGYATDFPASLSGLIAIGNISGNAIGMIMVAGV